MAAGMQNRLESKRWTWPEAGFVGVVIASVLAIGSVHPQVLAAVAIAATLVTYGQTRLDAEDRPLVRIPLPFIAQLCAGLSLYTLLQAIPLPLRILSALAPSNADVWAHSLDPLHTTPRWGALSLDPGASVVESLKWWTYASVTVAAARIARRRGLGWIAGVVFASATLTAAISTAHGLVGATRVFGIYTPQHGPSAWKLGPLMNANNLAGYLVLGATAGVGLMVERTRKGVPPWVVGVGVAFSSGVALLTSSRGGVVALFAAQLIFAGALIRRRSFGALLAVLASVGLGVALAFLGAALNTRGALLDADLSKFQMWSWSKRMVLEHPLFGIGRGAFESVSAAYQDPSGNRINTHAENFPLQWLSEWGVAVGGAALVGLAWSLRPWSLGVGRNRVAAGAWAGVLGLLIQNLVDLGLEVPGVSIGMFALVGALTSSKLRSHRSEVPPRASRGWWAIPVTVALSFAALAYGVPQVSSTRILLHDQYERVWLEAESGKRTAALTRLRDSLRLAMSSHPAEPYFPLLGAELAHRSRDESPMPWIQRALERGPNGGRTHLLLARILSESRAVSQATLELRLATQADGELLPDAATMLSLIATKSEHLDDAAPDGAIGAELLDRTAALFDKPTDANLRAAADRAALERVPTAKGPLLREANDLLAALSNRNSRRCPPDGPCVLELFARVTALVGADPSSCTAGEILARWLVLVNAPDVGDDVLTSIARSASDRSACLRARAALVARGRSPERLQQAAKDLAAATCATQESCAETMTFIGGLFASRADWPSAISAYDRACREQATRERLMMLAEVASKGGEHVRALEALRRVAASDPTDATVKKRIQEEFQSTAPP